MLGSKAPFIAVTLVTLCILPAFSFSATSSRVRPYQSPSMSLDSVCNKNAVRTFAGCTVLLTGASGGLGREFSLQLAHCKAHTLVLSGRNEESLKLVEQECKQIFPEIVTHIITCDLSDKDSVANLGRQALLMCNQRIDILINNGGVSSRSRFLDTKLLVDEQVMQVNFFAGVALAKDLVPGMTKQGFGKIIWVSSVQGLCKCNNILLGCVPL